MLIRFIICISCVCVVRRNSICIRFSALNFHVFSFSLHLKKYIYIIIDTYKFQVFKKYSFDAPEKVLDEVFKRK